MSHQSICCCLSIYQLTYRLLNSCREEIRRTTSLPIVHPIGEIKLKNVTRHTGESHIDILAPGVRSIYMVSRNDGCHHAQAWSVCRLL